MGRGTIEDHTGAARERSKIRRTEMGTNESSDLSEKLG